MRVRKKVELEEGIKVNCVTLIGSNFQQIPAVGGLVSSCLWRRGKIIRAVAAAGFQRRVTGLWINYGIVSSAIPPKLDIHGAPFLQHCSML